ncbi:MAG: hypothetical protein QM503_06580 [Bacteroidota bacterium]
METTPVTINTNNNSIWKWFAGLSLAGVVGFIGWKYFLNEQLPDSPPSNEETNDFDIDKNSEKYGILAHKFQILSNDEWANNIVAEAKQNGKKFKDHLNDVAIGKYVREGFPEERILKLLEIRIREFTIKIKQSGNWVDSIKDKAKTNNVTFEVQLQRDAAWSVINQLLKKYDVIEPPSNDDTNINQQTGQDGFNGIGAFMLSN